MEHCEDDAELFALGLTDPERSEEIEAHCATCAACRTRVIAAEATAAALASTLPAMPAAAAARRWGFGPAGSALAAAAAVVFAVTTGIEGAALHGTVQQSARTDVALAHVAASHFNHTTLSSPAGTAVKVLYARDGAWLYVIAEGLGIGVHAVVRQAGVDRDLGPLGPGNPATLFITAPGRVSDVALVADGHTVAHGTPAY